ncbi:MAG: hypothetical protein KJ072_06165 [Verrucomicrobia bacterium]|nr:hypothetical protein [Verrucomicrobiota bacterium]
MIQPTCRARFTARDVDFVVDVLGREGKGSTVLVGLLTDEETRDLILDDPELHAALLERGGCLEVSARFYFYVLVRRVLARAGIEDRAVADYVAELLSEYVRIVSSRCEVPGLDKPLEYFFEMLAALPRVDEGTAFQVRAHMGNHALFLAGLFKEHIEHRAARRGAPGLSYYEELGRTSYRVAGDHRLAQRYALSTVFGILSHEFEAARLALNDLSERVFTFGSGPDPAKILEEPGRN